MVACMLARGGRRSIRMPCLQSPARPKRSASNILAFSDHLVIANQVVSPYPYTKSRVWFAQDSGDCLDQLTTLAFVAAGTERLRLLTSVMVIPHRPPVLTAKMLASADILSKGRVTVGLGVGWMAEEIALLGAPTFERRGKLADETIAAMKALWTESDPEFIGEFVSFSDLKFEPKPVKSRTHRSGSAVKRGPRAAGPVRSATLGIPLGTTCSAI